MQRVVLLQFGKGLVQIVGQFLFFPLAGDSFNEHEGEKHDNHRNHQHVEQVLDERVLFEEVFVHNYFQ